MKRNIILLVIGIFSYSMQAQVPARIDFQAVARDAQGDILYQKNITIRLSIVKGPLPGSVIYQENHTVTTDDYGLFTLGIGSGESSEKTLHDVDWKKGPHFLRIELDPQGGTDYADMGTLELMTVPYAFYAKHAENIDDADADSLNELQRLDISGEVLSISNGNNVQLPDADSQNELQQLSLNGEVLAISDGNSVRLPDASAQNELQQLSVRENNLLSISNGNTVQLPASTSAWKTMGQTVYLDAPVKVGLGLKTAPHLMTLAGSNQAHMGFLTSATEVGQANGLVIGLNKLSHSAQIWNFERGDIRFGTDDETRMLISPLGRVGIGTTAPGEKLEVGSTTGDVGLRINAASNKMALLHLSEATTSGKRGYNWAYNGSGSHLLLYSQGFGHDSDPLMRIRPTGISEIGTNGPLNIRAIEGESTLLALSHKDQTATIQMGILRGIPIIDFRAEPLNIKAEGQVAISVNHNSGFVGIGRENPRLPLDVQGSMEVSEDLTIKEDTEIEGSLTIGSGFTFDQIQEFTGTTTNTGNNRDFPYPSGYNRSNTRILSLQIQFSTGNWGTTGAGDLEILHAVLFDNFIRIIYPPKNAYQNRPFRILLMRAGVKS